jgi:hypothetical protein
MKRSTKHSAVSSALVLTGLFMVGGVAQADTVVATFNGSDGVNINYSAILRGNNATVTGSGVDGLFQFTKTGGTPASTILTYPTDQFVSFCIDLADAISGGTSHTWDIVDLATAPDSTAGPMGQTQANNLALLLGSNISSGILNDARTVFATQIQRSAMQIAVWEVVYETTSPFDVTLGTAIFATNNGAVQTQANIYLGNMTSVKKSMQGLVGLTSETTQDFVGQVPIPAAAWLFGSALMGTVALGRRKLNKDKEVQA